MSFRPLFPALLAGVLVSFAGPASATIIYLAGMEIPIATGLEGTSVDLETGTEGALAGADANFFFGGAGISNDAFPGASVPTWQPVRTGTGNLDTVENLAFGAPVNAASTFGSGFGGSGDPNAHLGTTFTDGVPGYIGFSLDTGTGTVYGWMGVTLTANAPGGLIHEWAYEDSGAEITVGAVPEPGVSLLGLLSLGALCLRRKR